MFLSIDIGGTKTLIALFSSRGSLLKTFKFPTPKDPPLFLKTLTNALTSFFELKNEKLRPKAITIAVPGTIKIEQKNCSVTCENLGWTNFNLLTPIKQLFSCQIFLANDANLATLYEISHIHTTKKTIYLTFSTGIGGGIAKDGRLSSSSDAFEPGHKVYSFENANLEWEDIASAKILSQIYCSPLKSLKLTPEIKTDIISRLSLGISDIIKSESPEILIIGGPLGYIINRLKRPLINSLKNILNPLPKIIKAHRPEQSVIYGAYLYSKQHYKDNP